MTDFIDPEKVEFGEIRSIDTIRHGGYIDLKPIGAKKSQGKLWFSTALCRNVVQRKRNGKRALAWAEKSVPYADRGARVAFVRTDDESPEMVGLWTTARVFAYEQVVAGGVRYMITDHDQNELWEGAFSLGVGRIDLKGTFPTEQTGWYITYEGSSQLTTRQEWDIYLTLFHAQVLTR